MLFFAAVWVMPLNSDLPEMTWITLSCLGGEAEAASVGWLPVLIEESLGLIGKELLEVSFLQ